MIPHDEQYIILFLILLTFYVGVNMYIYKYSNKGNLLIPYLNQVYTYTGFFLRNCEIGIIAMIS